MKKKIANKAAAATKKRRRKSKGRKDWVSTSIAFKKENIEFIDAHELTKRGDVSRSWIVNKLIEKFRAGDITLEIE